MRRVMTTMLLATLVLGWPAGNDVASTRAFGQTKAWSPVPVPPPKLAKPKVTIPLGEPAKRMRAGGGGRYLIFLLEKAAKLAVVDLSAADVVHKINLPSPDVCFAAGREKLIVVSPGQKLMHRYNLADFKREKTVPVPTEGNVLGAVMGCSSDGPLLLWPGGNTVYFDLNTLKPIRVQGKVLNGSPRYGYALRVSADGQVFMGWTTGISGQVFAAMRLLGNTPVIKHTPDSFSYNERWAMPNADASLYFRFRSGIYNHNLQVVAADRFKGAVLLPTEDPRYFLAVRGPGKNKPSEASICTTADRRVVHTVKDLEPMTSSSLSPRHGLFWGEPRVRFLPTADLLVTVPESNDQVVLRRFNLAEALNKSGEKYLFVNSAPRPFAPAGAEYVYQIDVLSKAGGVKCKLESGPPNMRVSDSGQVRWRAKSSAAGETAEAIVVITDAGGQEIFHSFEVTVVPRTLAVALRPERPTPRPRPSKPRHGPARPEKPAKTPPDKPATKPGTKPDQVPDTVQTIPEVPRDALKLQAAAYQIVPGIDGRSLLLLQGDQLKVLGPDGLTVRRTLTLEKKYTHVAERANYYVALAEKPTSFDVIDKKTLKARVSRAFSCMGCTDLALHPTKSISYVAFKGGVKPPRYRFIFFDERTGTGRESDDLIGTWLAVDPKGQWLIAAYRDIYEQGSRLIVNPDRLHVVPKYGSIDWLIRYRIGRNGVPVIDALKEKAGGNGKGLRLSRDGARVTYLSHVGYPEFSGNLAGWDPTDLKELPVSYATKDRGTTYDLAYHPVLPLVASPGSGSAVFFHRETGALEKNRLKLPKEGLGDVKLHRVYFSPDGRHLLLEASAGETHYLQKFELELSARELQAVKSGALKPVRPSRAETPRPTVTVALKELQALAGGRGKDMSTKEIARAFMDSVAVIRTDEGGGTGFFVGRDGYVLTCAHVLPDQGDVTVLYRDKSFGKLRLKEAVAKMVRVDEELDLALLKIDTPKKMLPVRMAPPREVESGEHVAIIGNPGLGPAVLDYTMTEGIVSNANRRILGQTFIQTSAAVNPGCSGGPMFNAKGLVVGLVVLKANIESTGFAVPAEQLTAFLVAASQHKGPQAWIDRQWTDATGKYQIDATYQGCFDGKVHLKRPGGQKITVPLDKLSEGDQRFVRILTEP